MWPRRLMGVVGTIGALLLLAPAPAALAHGDERLWDGPFTLPPGEALVIEGSVHYHRLVADITADGPIAVTLVDPATDAIAVASRTGESITLNVLVACCEDRAWTPHLLLIENPNAFAVTGAGRVFLVHDDVAVMVHRAESGAAESVVVMGAVWMAVLWRVRRRVTGTSAARATITFGGLAASVLILAWYGLTRYGEGGIPALVGALSDIPVIPSNPIVSRSSLLMGAAMVGWAISAVRWLRAESTMPRPGWWALGAFVVGSVLLVGTLAATRYGAIGMPAALATAAILPLVLAAAGALDPTPGTVRTEQPRVAP